MPPLQRRLVSAEARGSRDMSALKEMLSTTGNDAWPRTVWPMIAPGSLPAEVLDSLISDLTLRGCEFARPWLEKLAGMDSHPLQGIALFMLAYHFPASLPAMQVSD